MTGIVLQLRLTVHYQPADGETVSAEEIAFHGRTRLEELIRQSYNDGRLSGDSPIQVESHQVQVEQLTAGGGLVIPEYPKDTVSSGGDVQRWLNAVVQPVIDALGRSYGRAAGATRLKPFPTMLRKMWTSDEVDEWVGAESREVAMALQGLKFEIAFEGSPSKHVVLVSGEPGGEGTGPREDFAEFLTGALGEWYTGATITKLAPAEPVELQTPAAAALSGSVFLANLHYFFARTDGSYQLPGGSVGDLLRQAQREIGSRT